MEVSVSAEEAVGCARPAGGPVGEEVDNTSENKQSTIREERSVIIVGKKAPDFTAPAFHEGAFNNVKLSDYLGQ